MDPVASSGEDGCVLSNFVSLDAGSVNATNSNTNNIVTIPFSNNGINDKPKEKLQKPWRKYIGLALALIASFSFSVNSVASKQIVGKYGVYLVSFSRTQGVFYGSLVILLYILYVKKEKSSVSFKDKKTIFAIVARGCFGTVVTLSFTGALKYISVGDTLVLKSTSPLIVVFFASCCLNEGLGLARIICGIQIVLGVFCIAKPPIISGEEEYDIENLIGTILGLSVAVAAALGIICMRFTRKVHFSIPALSMGVVGSLSSGIMCAANGDFRIPENITDALLLVVVAVCTAVTQILTVVALQYDQAGQTALVRTSEIFFGFLLEITLLGNIPDQLSAIGAIIVVLAVTMAVVSKKK